MIGGWIKASTVVDLDARLRAGCQVPHCGHKHPAELVLAARCHPGAKGVRVIYGERVGCLTIRCPVCEAHVADIAVSALTATETAVAAGALGGGEGKRLTVEDQQMMDEVSLRLLRLISGVRAT